jgi:hypothetical protein
MSRDLTEGASRSPARWPLIVIFLIGVALVVVPFAISLPSKAAAGQRMLNDFHPIMRAAHVRETVSYYNTTFTPLGEVAAGATIAASELPSLVTTLAAALHTTPVGVETLLKSKMPAMAGLLLSFPKLVPIFDKVPSGLAFYKPLVQTMHQNVANYRGVDSLPNFNLFTWFFVVPGALLILLAGFGLISSRRSRPAAA